MGSNRFTQLSYSTLRDLPLVQLPFEQLDNLLNKYQVRDDAFKALSQMPLDYLTNSAEDVKLANTVQGYREKAIRNLADIAKTGDVNRYMNALQQSTDNLLSMHTPGGVADFLKNRKAAYNAGMLAIDEHVKDFKLRNIYEPVFEAQMKAQLTKTLEGGGIYDPVTRSGVNIGDPQLQAEYLIDEELDKSLKDFQSSTGTEIRRGADGMHYIVTETEQINQKHLDQYIDNFYNRPEVLAALDIRQKYADLTMTPEQKAGFVEHYKDSAITKKAVENTAILQNISLNIDKTKNSKDKREITAYQQHLNRERKALGLSEIKVTGGWGKETEAAAKEYQSAVTGLLEKNMQSFSGAISNLDFRSAYIEYDKANITNGMAPKYAWKKEKERIEWDQWKITQAKISANRKLAMDMYKLQYENDNPTLFSGRLASVDNLGSTVDQLNRSSAETTGLIQGVVNNTFSGMTAPMKNWVANVSKNDPKLGLRILHQYQKLIDSGSTPEKAIETIGSQHAFSFTGGTLQMNQALQQLPQLYNSDNAVGFDALRNGMRNLDELERSKQEIDFTRQDFVNKATSQLTDKELEDVVFYSGYRKKPTTYSGDTSTQGANLDTYSREEALKIIQEHPEILGTDKALEVFRSKPNLKLPNSSFITDISNADLNKEVATLFDPVINNIDSYNLTPQQRTIIDEAKSKNNDSLDKSISNVNVSMVNLGGKTKPMLAIRFTTGKTIDIDVSSLDDNWEERVVRHLKATAYNPNNPNEVVNGQAQEQLHLYLGQKYTHFGEENSYSAIASKLQTIEDNQPYVAASGYVNLPNAQGGTVEVPTYNLVYRAAGSGFYKGTEYLIHAVTDEARDYVMNMRGDDIASRIALAKDKINKGAKVSEQEASILRSIDIVPVKGGTLSTDQYLEFTNSYEKDYGAIYDPYITPYYVRKDNTNRTPYYQSILGYIQD